MEKKHFLSKQNKDVPETHQSYNCDGTVITVEPIFKTTGARTLVYSIGQIVYKYVNDSEQS